MLAMSMPFCLCLNDYLFNVQQSVIQWPIIIYNQTEMNGINVVAVILCAVDKH